MSNALQAINLSKILSGEIEVTLIENVDFEIKKGEFVAIMGPSGSGKSSLLYLLGLLDKPTKGSLFIAGQDVSRYTDEELGDCRLSKMGFVFQFHFLLAEFTALENVMIPMKQLGKLSISKIHERAQALLAAFGIGQHIQKYPRQLSGGESQRVAIARALANDPDIIFADEPTGNLDSFSSKNVKEIFKKISHEEGKSVIVVTHDPEFARTADRIVYLVDGKIDLNNRLFN